jgi:hypothetical protein
LGSTSTVSALDAGVRQFTVRSSPVDRATMSFAVCIGVNTSLATTRAAHVVVADAIVSVS